MFRSQRMAVPLAMALGLVAASRARAAVIEYATPSTAMTSGGAVSATAFFTINNGSVTITLNDLLQNPGNDAQLISGIKFDITGASGTGTLASSSGKVTTLNSSDGSYTPPGSATSLNSYYQVQTSGTNLDLNIYNSSQPDGQIIGPDSKGGFTGSGTYSNANSSIYNHQPDVLGTATFTINIAGVTTASTLSNVTFEFGTAQGSNLVFVPTAVPEPSTYVLAGVMAALAGACQLRDRRRAIA